VTSEGPLVEASPEPGFSEPVFSDAPIPAGLAGPPVGVMAGTQRRRPRQPGGLKSFSLSIP
jgi:hypothetical protein